MNWLKPPTDGSGVHGARRGVLRFSPRRFTQHSFLTIVISHRYRNMKSDAPTEVNPRDVVATGQATPSQSILTPSTIGRDDILSQVTREHSSLDLSDSFSLDSGKSKGQTRGPFFTAQSTTFSVGGSNFGRSALGCIEANCLRPSTYGPVFFEIYWVQYLQSKLGGLFHRSSFAHLFHRSRLNMY